MGFFIFIFNWLNKYVNNTSGAEVPKTSIRAHGSVYEFVAGVPPEKMKVRRPFRTVTPPSCLCPGLLIPDVVTQEVSYKE